MVSKACIVGQYQSKLEALAQHKDIELTVVVPPYWKDERGKVDFEHGFTRGYDLRIEPMLLNGHFHLHYYPTLPALVRTTRPHIVHIDEEPYNLATFHALRASGAVGAKALFFTWQNLQRRYPFPFSWFESYALKHSAYAIAGNHAAADVLRAKNFRGPIRVIPQFGVNLDHYAPRPDQDSRAGPFRIGFVGRLVPEKGPQVLMHAAAGLQGDWELLFVGSGPMQPHLASLANELGISERVHFEPWVSSDRMPSIYHRMDTVVLPSLTRPNWKEQFGRVLIEAMACALPVVGSDSGEIPNVIGDAGLIFHENEPDALRARLEQLQCDPVARTELGKRGWEHVLRHYMQDQIAEQTYQVYCEMVSDKTKGLLPTADSRLQIQ